MQASESADAGRNAVLQPAAADQSGAAGAGGHADTSTEIRTEQQRERVLHVGKVPNSGLALAVTVSPSGTLHAGGSPHLLSNPAALYDILMGIRGLWASHNETLRREYVRQATLPTIACSGNLLPGIGTIRSCTGELRHLLARLILLVHDAVAPRINALSPEAFLEEIKQAGAHCTAVQRMNCKLMPCKQTRPYVDVLPVPSCLPTVL